MSAGSQPGTPGLTVDERTITSMGNNFAAACSYMLAGLDHHTARPRIDPVEVITLYCEHARRYERCHSGSSKESDWILERLPWQFDTIN